MKLASPLILIAAVSVSQASGADWDYPTGGPTSISESSLGKAGKFRTYQILTKDKSEKVTLWYAEQLGLGEDNGLVKAAEAGFDQLETHSTFDYVVGRDTNKEKWGALILASVSAKHASVQIFVRPENDPSYDVTISIHQTSMGTLVTVIQSVPTEAKQNVAKAK
jgi:hypothetical protein